MRIAVVVGTRPEGIKLAPIAELLGSEALVIYTGQHFSPGMSGHLAPDIVLDTSTGCGVSRGQQLGELVTSLDQVFDEHQLQTVVVQGDTTSALAGALAANTARRYLVHVEAGLRSFDRAMPEETNRVLIDHLSDLCCAPTALARRNLIAEGIEPERIEITGNTIVEAVAAALPEPSQQSQLLATFGLTEGGFVLATIHRPENVDVRTSLASILDQLARSPVPVVFPVHPRTRRRIADFGLNTVANRLLITGPLQYSELLTLTRKSAGIITDSGGIQEEVTILKRPILIIRRSNERPEVEERFGSRNLPNWKGITATIATWLQEASAINAQLAQIPTPFGDGTASNRIVRALRSLSAESVSASAT